MEQLTNFTVPVDTNNHTQCFNVTIINDTRYELDEVFSIKLSASEESIQITPSLVPITITDDDSKF